MGRQLARLARIHTLRSLSPILFTYITQSWPSRDFSCERLFTEFSRVSVVHVYLYVHVHVAVGRVVIMESSPSCSRTSTCMKKKLRNRRECERVRRATETAEQRKQAQNSRQGTVFHLFLWTIQFVKAMFLPIYQALSISPWKVASNDTTCTHFSPSEKFLWSILRPYWNDYFYYTYLTIS